MLYNFYSHLYFIINFKFKLYISFSISVSIHVSLFNISLTQKEILIEEVRGKSDRIMELEKTNEEVAPVKMKKISQSISVL